MQLNTYLSRKVMDFLMFLKTLNKVSSAQNPKKNYLSFNFFAFFSYQDKQLFTNKRWIHYDVPICSRELKNRNFLVKFVVISVAITEFVTFGFRIVFFSEFYESLALLACQPQKFISIVFFIKAMWFYKPEIVFVRFPSFCRHFFYFVCISRCLTHGVRGIPVKISLQASVLTFRAEMPVLAN